MTAEPEHSPAESADVREARRAIGDHLGRAAAAAERGEAADADRGRSAVADLARWRERGRIDDRLAEEVARAAWDAVQDATPPPPSPEAGPTEKTRPSPERAELHRRAVSVARGLRELGYHVDDTLLPGPDMAAG
ncbi:hypothetical protein J7E93_34705 [Streptomyces sp. ISL-36]|uniref:hypothetical protein n=1 Tax=Streptomyces sp. ISL-36 TaxID=2819182 RepID=UPI001BE54D2C|nr:hypothetical protein [Streptomyces sp. ISL-36]MBT2445147.1 hypothetical protein [Streptomyces sp. ISL-36]